MPFRTLLVFLSLSCWLLIPLSGFAQSNDYIEDNSESLWQQDQFVDPSTSIEEPLEKNSSEYIGQEEADAMETQSRFQEESTVNVAAALEKDAKLLPNNIRWGIATGVILGAWLALNNSTSARENARYIGSGAVFGAILGISVGAKSLYQTELGPGPLQLFQAAPAKQTGWAINPTLDRVTKSLGTKVQYRMTF